MDLKPEDIIKGAITTSKSRWLFDKEGKLSFRVSKEANKLMIRKAVETIWDVKVDKVAVINTKGKRRRFSGRPFVTRSSKKAIITLKKGYKIEMPWQQVETTPVAADQQPVEGS